MAKFNDEWLVSPAIMQRLVDESEDTEGRYTGFWGAFTKANGDIVFGGNIPAPCEFQRMFAADMAKGLNDNLRHDGVWLVFWTHPPVAMAVDADVYRVSHLLWLDEDGDPQFTVDNEDPFHEVMEAGFDHWIEAAEDAWQQWEEARDTLDLSPGQTFKKVRGELPPSLKGLTVH